MFVGEGENVVLELWEKVGELGLIGVVWECGERFQELLIDVFGFRFLYFYSWFEKVVFCLKLLLMISQNFKVLFFGVGFQLLWIVCVVFVIVYYFIMIMCVICVVFLEVIFILNGVVYLLFLQGWGNLVLVLLINII